jgi:capsular polysaccharide biosynthesis protein
LLNIFKLTKWLKIISILNIKYILLIFIKKLFCVLYYYEFILSANVYLPKYTESILGRIYFENNDNNNPKAKNTNIIWCEKKKGTNCGIKMNYLIISKSHNKN